MDSKSIAAAIACAALWLAADCGGAEAEPPAAERPAPQEQAQAEAADEEREETEKTAESPDVFVPSESISEDISVPFPVDI